MPFFLRFPLSFRIAVDRPNQNAAPPGPAPLRRLLILTSALIFWLLMMAVHESGHALGAWATGGRVTRVILSPLAISRTDVSPNPSPLTVAWCGPLFGAGGPVLLCLAATSFRWPLRSWLRAFAGFCLIANGLYLASGVLTPAGDTEELLRFGAGRAALGLTGVPLACAGFWLWHTLGRQWGLAGAGTDKLRAWALRSCVALVVIAAAMLVTSR